MHINWLIYTQVEHCHPFFLFLEKQFQHFRESSCHQRHQQHCDIYGRTFHWSYHEYLFWKLITGKLLNAWKLFNYNGKEVLTHSKVGKEKWLAQIFRKDLTERKLDKTRMKIILSASPSLLFSRKVHNIRFEKQIVFCPN